MNEPRLKILCLCTGNSCRSQMAEGRAKHLKSETLDVLSAGIERHGLNPLSVKAMADAGVDIGRQTSKTVDQLPTLDFDYVVTLCGHANETCPLFPGKAKVVHMGLTPQSWPRRPKARRRPWCITTVFETRSAASSKRCRRVWKR